MTFTVLDALYDSEKRDPYSPKVQNLLQVTNLRIRLTRLTRSATRLPTTQRRRHGESITTLFTIFSTRQLLLQRPLGRVSRSWPKHGKHPSNGEMHASFLSCWAMHNSAFRLPRAPAKSVSCPLRESLRPVGIPVLNQQLRSPLLHSRSFSLLSTPLPSSLRSLTRSTQFANAYTTPPGPNCRECAPLYNDAPWQPGYSFQPNVCQGEQNCEFCKAAKSRKETTVILEIFVSD